MSKYKPIYKDDMSRITYAIMNGMSLESAGVKPTARNLQFYTVLKREIEDIKDSGQGIILPS
jgi:hypothetical protein